MVVRKNVTTILKLFSLIDILLNYEVDVEKHVRSFQTVLQVSCHLTSWKNTHSNHAQLQHRRCMAETKRMKLRHSFR